jgi:glycosyltransferase involved in cell wall biosynthesis
MSNADPARIVGITLVRNEDVFVERAVRNALDFCDRLIIADHYSTDGTFEIVSKLAAEFPGKIDLHRITDTRESHFLISGFAGSRTWVFAVDGDEVYDPTGLMRLREEVLAGQYDEWWLVFGNVLNCTAVDAAAGTATGHLAPPCRSMTKLFNFNLIESWDGAVTHVMANGTIRFKPGYDASRRLDLHQRFSWDESHYRCLHTCFVPRSSLDRESALARPNVSENRRSGVTTLVRKTLDRLLGRPPVSEWKLEKYARGPLVTIDARAFFPPDAGAVRT